MILKKFKIQQLELTKCLNAENVELIRLRRINYTRMRMKYNKIIRKMMSSLRIMIHAVQTL